MSTRQLIGLIGSLILLLGVFCPLVSIPIAGSMNYFQNGKGDGIIIITLSLISIVFIIINNLKPLIITSLASIAVMIFTFFSFHSKLTELTVKLNKELAGNPFKGLSDAAIQSVQLQWGWALMIIGAILMLIAGWQFQNYISTEKPIPETDTKKCPICAEIIKYEAIKCRFCGHEFDRNEDVISEQEQDIGITKPVDEGNYVAQCPMCQTWSTRSDWCFHCEKPFQLAEETPPPTPEPNPNMEIESEEPQVAEAKEEIGEDIRFHSKQCPKCGYERQPNDDEIIPLYECPRCHIVYHKYVSNKTNTNDKSTLAFVLDTANAKKKLKCSQFFLKIIKKPLDASTFIVICVIAFILATLYLYENGIKPYIETQKLLKEQSDKYDEIIKKAEKYKDVKIKTPEELREMVRRATYFNSNARKNIHIEKINRMQTRKDLGIIEMDITIANGNTFDISDVMVECTYKDSKKTEVLVQKKTLNDVIKANSSKTFTNIDMGYFHPQTATASCGVVDSKIAP